MCIINNIFSLKYFKSIDKLKHTLNPTCKFISCDFSVFTFLSCNISIVLFLLLVHLLSSLYVFVYVSFYVCMYVCLYASIYQCISICIVHKGTTYTELFCLVYVLLFCLLLRLLHSYWVALSNLNIKAFVLLYLVLPCLDAVSWKHFSISAHFSN